MNSQICKPWGTLKNQQQDVNTIEDCFATVPCIQIPGKRNDIGSWKKEKEKSSDGDLSKDQQREIEEREK